MSQPTAVPIPPDLTGRYSRTATGREWLASLPGVTAGLLERWRLVPDLAPGSLPWNGHGAVVVPVLREDGRPAALKIAFPHEEARVERHALALWGGHGAVTLLAADAGVDGVLVVDYPPEESEVLTAHLRARNLDSIFLLSPTTTAARVKKADELGKGFLYAISRLGVTGVREQVADDARDDPRRVGAQMPPQVDHPFRTPLREQGKL